MWPVVVILGSCWKALRQTSSYALKVYEQVISPLPTTLEQLYSCLTPQSWGHHEMEILSVLLGFCEGNATVTSGFPSQRARNVELWCFLCCRPEQTIEHTVEWMVIWAAHVMIYGNHPRLSLCVWCIFVNEVLYFDQISLKFPIDNKPALVQIMAWHLHGAKPLSESILTWFIEAYVTSGKMVKFVSGWTLSRSVWVCQKCCIASSHTSSNPQIQEFPAVGAGWLYQPLYPLPGTPVMKHQPWKSVWKRPQLHLLCSHGSGDLRISLVPVPGHQACSEPGAHRAGVTGNMETSQGVFPWFLYMWINSSKPPTSLGHLVSSGGVNNNNTKLNRLTHICGNRRRWVKFC